MEASEGKSQNQEPPESANASGGDQPITANEASSTTMASPRAAMDDKKRKRDETNQEQGEGDENSSTKRVRLRSSSKDADSKPEPTGEETTTTTAPVEVASEKATEETKNNTNAPTKKGGSKNQKKVVMRVNQMAEEYVELSSRMMLIPTTNLGPYGYEESGTQVNGQRSYPLELISSLGFLKSPLRRPTVMEKWSPYEISLFEAGMGHYGKDFHQIHKLIQTKSTKEVIDFYYIWKKTSHYKVWKEQYVAPGEIIADEEMNSTPVKKPIR